MRRRPARSHLLESARVFASLEEAVADLNFVYATTARERGQVKRVEAPGAAMAEAAAARRAGQKRGVLFGPERTGLDNDEVSLADAIITFPVNPAYASLNLAQAVLLCGYEWFKAAHGDAPPAPAIRGSRGRRRAKWCSRFSTFSRPGSTSAASFARSARSRGCSATCATCSIASAMTQQDVRTLWGAVVRLVEGPRVNVQTRKRARRAKTDA